MKFWVLTILSLGVKLFAQNFSLYTGYGATMQHNTKLGHLITERPFFLEADYSKSSTGYYAWQRDANFPDYGLCLNFQTLGNNDKLGQSIALAPYLEFPFSKKQKRVLFKMKMAWGLAYLTKKFDVETDHKNTAIGSHFNTFIQFRFLWNIKLSEQWCLNPAITFIHVSNCRFSVPNLGINTLYPSVGIQYQLNKSNHYNIPQDSSTQKKYHHEILGFAAIGANEVEPPTHQKLAAYSFGINYYYNARNNQQFGVGADVFYEQSFAHDIRPTDTSQVKYNFQTCVTSGVKLCYAYNFGRIAIPIEFGVYTYSPSGKLPNGIFYHRLGCRYYFKNGLVAHFSLKTHFAIAYHIEAGLGYRFFIKKKMK